jgi:uncharacterized protein YndB with AHSA1/START domain
LNPQQQKEGATMNFTYAIQINAPIASVFNLVDDDDMIKLWMDGLEETIYPEGKNRLSPVGTKFKQRIREGSRVAEYEGQVIAYEKSNLLAITIGNAQFEMEVVYRFTPKGAWTWLDYSATMRRGNLFIKLMGKLFAPLTRRILDKQMKKLKEIAECETHAEFTANVYAA